MGVNAANNQLENAAHTTLRYLEYAVNIAKNTKRFDLIAEIGLSLCSIGEAAAVHNLFDEAEGAVTRSKFIIKYLIDEDEDHLYVEDIESLISGIGNILIKSNDVDSIYLSLNIIRSLGEICKELAENGYIESVKVGLWYLKDIYFNKPHVTDGDIQQLIRSIYYEVYELGPQSLRYYIELNFIYCYDFDTSPPLN